MKAAGSHIRAWRPAIPGISEVLHATFTDFAYPPHTHDGWTLLIVDDGCISYQLARRHYTAYGQTVTLLPPQIPHDGSTVYGSFRKRVLYLETTELDVELAAVAVDRPALPDLTLHRRIASLHQSLTEAANDPEPEIRLAFIIERLRRHLGQVPDAEHTGRQRMLAHALRDLLDEHFVRGMRLQEAATLLGVNVTHLIRAFSAEFGISPHQYVIGRRVSLARRLLLAGEPVEQVAGTAGFYDQPHLTRSFRRIVGMTPGQFARSAGRLAPHSGLTGPPAMSGPSTA
jgi:AraC-like DNA-binding protein